MSKFSGSSSRPVRGNLHSPVRTTEDRIPTFEGAGAYTRDAESDLFLLAVTNMVGENTFYENASTRDKRFVDLIHTVTKGNPAFIAGSDPENGKIGLAQYLRQEGLMRSASTVMAAEYIAAGGPHGRSVVNRTLQRPDEPAEILGYWLSTYGRKFPLPLKRGVADAVRRLYHERSVLRYDGQSRDIRMGDVVELVHPSPKDANQSALFKFLLDKRHRGTDARLDLSLLPVLTAATKLDSMSGEELRAFVKENGVEVLSDAGYSWERLSGKMKMDAEAWTMILGSMGVMAKVRNLRNFDEADISDEAVDQVINSITDAEQVAKARLFPYQVWAAYSNAPSDNWKRALGKTLDLTTQNIPDNLNGTLVVVDCSGSMQGTVSNRSQMSRYEVAAVLGAACFKGTQDSDVVIFGDTNKKLEFPLGTSALRVVERISNAVKKNEVGSSTFGHTAIRDHFDAKKHRRVILVTDDQMWDSDGGDTHAYRTYGYHGRPPVNIDHVPLIYTVNLAGYRPSSLKSGEKGRYSLGGFSDASFTMMSVLEAGRDADWPF